MTQHLLAIGSRWLCSQDVLPCLPSPCTPWQSKSNRNGSQALQLLQQQNPYLPNFPCAGETLPKFILKQKTTKQKHHHLVMKSSLKNIDAKLLHKESQNPTIFLTDPSKQKETGKWVLGLLVPASHHHSLPTTLPYPTHSRRKKDCKSIYLFTCLFFAEMGRRRNSQRGGKESVDNMISESRKVSLKNPPSG